MKRFDKFLLFSYISYISIFILIFILGISGVFAASYTGFDYTAQLYDNVNGNLTAVTTAGPTAGPGSYEGYIAYTANSSGGSWGISSPTTLLANHTYTLTASIPNECGYLVLSTYNRIGVGTSLSNAKTSYQNNTNVTEVYSKVIGGDNFLIQFAFTPSINGSYIVFPYATNKSCSSSRTILESISIEDLGIDAATQEDINNSLNQQTTEINNTINNLGTEIKDSINDNFNSCRPSVNIAYNVTYYSQTNDWWKIVDVIETDIKQGETYTISVYLDADATTYAYWNDADGVFPSPKEFTVKPGLNRYSYTFVAQKDATSINQTMTKYGVGDGIRITSSKLQIQKGSVMTEYEEPNKEICQNKIDETNNQLGDLNNSLNDSNSLGATDDASNFFSNFTTDTFGLTSIVTAPLSLINTITSSSCSSLRLPLPYLNNKFLELPCLNTIYSRYFGSFFNLYQTITFGIVAYWVIVRIFNQVKDFKNPDHDEIEVLDL